MKMAPTAVTLALLVAFSVAGSATAQTGNAFLTADEVVGEMMQHDAVQSVQFGSYTATRRYIALNGGRRAEMLVAVKCAGDGAKEFDILSEEGSSIIRKNLFDKTLAEETEATRRSAATNVDVSPANYEVRLIGRDRINERPAYLLELTPKVNNRFLIVGKIWVDAVDYSIIRAEGRLAGSPSFWVRSVHFVQTYQKVGPIWLAASTRAVIETRVFGEAELTIETSDYKLSPANDRTAKAEYLAGLRR
jgi:negative regulator of sigma E activity